MRTVTLTEYQAIPGLSINCLIDGLLPKPGRILLTGPPKEGKSYLALGLALAVAQGQPFLGRHTHPGRVLYLQFDTPSHIWQDRLAQLAEAGVSLAGDFHLLHPEDTLRTVDVRRDLHRLALQDVVQRVQPDLVVIDVLRKIHNAEENDSTAMKGVFDILNGIFAQQCVVYLHHTFKLNADFRPSPSNAGRGSSFMAGEVDANWLLYQNCLTIDSRIDEPCAYRAQRDERTHLWTFPETVELASLAVQVARLCVDYPDQGHQTLADVAKQRFGISRATYYRLLKRVGCPHTRGAGAA